LPPRRRTIHKYHTGVTTRNPVGHGPQAGTPNNIGLHKAAMTVQGCALLAEQPVPSLLKTKQEGSAYENPADSCDTSAWYLWAPGGWGVGRGGVGWMGIGWGGMQLLFQ